MKEQYSYRTLVEVFRQYNTSSLLIQLCIVTVFLYSLKKKNPRARRAVTMNTNVFVLNHVETKADYRFIPCMSVKRRLNM